MIREYVVVGGVAHLHTKHTVQYARPLGVLSSAAKAPVVRTVAGIVVAHRVRIGGIHHVKDLEPVLVAGHEHIRPANLEVVDQISPVGIPTANLSRNRLNDTVKPGFLD